MPVEEDLEDIATNNQSNSVAMGVSVVPTNDMYASATAGIPSEGNDVIRSSHSKLTMPLHRLSLASSILSVKLTNLQGIRARNEQEKCGKSHNTRSQSLASMIVNINDN